MNVPIDIDHLISTTQQLIRIPTINPPGQNYSDLVDIIVPELRSIGIEIEILEIETGYPIVIGWLNRGAKPEIHFNGHYDVVPASENWKTPPFQGVIRNQKIYGRGSADMKGGIATIVETFASIIHSKEKICGCLSMSLVPDEETDGLRGTARLVNANIINPDMAIIPEPTFPRLLLGHKGQIGLLVKILGASAHAAMPTLGGKNAFEQMIKVAHAIIQNWRIDNGIIRSLEHLYPLDSDIRSLPTLTLGGICSSGQAINSVPGQCIFSIDRRFTSVENCDEVLREIENFIINKGFPCEISRSVMIDASVMSHEEGARLLDPLQNSIMTVFGEKAPEVISAASMDTRFFREKWNIPCIAYGPGESGVAHIDNEYIRIDRMAQVVQVYLNLIESVCRVDSTN